MFVVEAIPLKRGVQIDRLSYFSSVEYSLGSIISIPVRSKTALAIVVKAEPVSATKTALKAATFSLRKLPTQDSTGTLPPGLMATATELTNYYPTEIGTLIFNLLPAEIRTGAAPLPDIPPSELKQNNPVAELPAVLQAVRADRYITYRSLVRETFAHSGSVVFVVPTSADVESAIAALEPGIEDRIVYFAPTQTKGERTKAYKGFADCTKSKLIVTTPTHAYLDRHDITTIIVDNAQNQSYTARRRPYVNHLEVLRIYAEKTGRRLVLGDLVLRTEEEADRRVERKQTIGEHPKRLALPAKLKVLEHVEKPTSYEPFPLFTAQLLEVTKETLTERGRIFMHAARRGLAPVVACIDCGFIFRCPDSGVPYSLLRTYKNGEEQRWFISSTAGKRLKAADVCEHCGSWRLKERGIGIQQMYDELKKEFPKAEIILFDHTTATTYKRAIALRNQFYRAKQGALLIGTNMALPYLHTPVQNSVVTSMDALSANPTWRNQEDVFSLLLTLRERTEQNVFVQCRGEIDPIVKLAEQGAVEQFYDEEIELRQSLNYPPFATFVHLTWQGTFTAVQQIEQQVTTALDNFPLDIYSDPETTKLKTIRYGLVRIPASDWPNPKLMQILKSLSPAVRIMINPDRIV